MPETGQGWRILDGVPTAWFDALSLREGARLAVRVLEQVPEAAVDVRTTGVRVRLDPGADPAAVSAAASELGLAADPGVPQRLGVLVDAGDPAAVRPFWQRALAYVASGDGALVDPLRRDPPMRILRLRRTPTVAQPDPPRRRPPGRGGRARRPRRGLRAVRRVPRGP